MFTLDKKLIFINIDQDYLRKLHSVCSEVYYKPNGYDNKPYIGILVNKNDRKYVISLIGKTLVLLIAPINTIVISYLTKRRELLNRSQFGKAVLAGGGVAGVFFLGCQVGTPLFVWLFYHDLFPSIKGLVTVVNLAQVLGLFSAFLFILVLTFTDEKWQLWIQLAHFVILLTASVLAAKNYGMIGFALACLGANTLRVVAVIALGIWKAKPAKKEGE